MHTRKVFIVIIFVLIAQSSFAQQFTDIHRDYFGRVPPDSVPVKFAPGIISKDGRYEMMAAFSPNGSEFCFTVTDNMWSGFKLLYTKFNGTKWQEPEILSFAIDGFSPVFSPFSNALFYTTGTWQRKPGSIWYCKKNGALWGQPEKLKNPINLDSGSNNWGFSIAGDGTILFSSERVDTKGKFDIYISEPVNNQYKNAINIENINSPTSEYSAYIAPDKNFIIFSSQRSGGYGWDDLYITFRKKDSSWSDPVNLGPGINTINAEFSPFVTPDGKYLLYSVWDKDSRWSDIYWVRIDYLIEKIKNKIDLTKDTR